MIRAVRREFSRRIADAPPQSVVQPARHLLDLDSDLLRSDLNLALEVKHAGALQLDPSLGKPANDLSAAR